LAISKLRTDPAGITEALKDTAFVVPFARAETQYFKNALYFPSEDEEAAVTEPTVQMDQPTLLPASSVAQCAVKGGMQGGLPWILRHADRIAHIPTKIVHGRQDIVCRPRAAMELHRRVPGSTLDFVFDAGHSDSEPGIIHHLVNYTDAFVTESLVSK
jgi:pimeloyl-ACP methyl ester carboxylesterase